MIHEIGHQFAYFLGITPTTDFPSPYVGLMEMHAVENSEGATWNPGAAIYEFQADLVYYYMDASGRPNTVQPQAPLMYSFYQRYWPATSASSYSSTKYSSANANCPQGRYSVFGSHDMTTPTCRDCPTGKYSAANAIICTDCASTPFGSAHCGARLSSLNNGITIGGGNTWSISGTTITCTPYGGSAVSITNDFSVTQIDAGDNLVLGVAGTNMYSFPNACSDTPSWVLTSGGVTYASIGPDYVWALWNGGVWYYKRTGTIVWVNEGTTGVLLVDVGRDRVYIVLNDANKTIKWKKADGSGSWTTLAALPSGKATHISVGLQNVYVRSDTSNAYSMDMYAASPSWVSAGTSVTGAAAEW